MPHQPQGESPTMIPESDLAQRLSFGLLTIVSGLALVMFTLVVLTLITPFRLPGKPGWGESVLLCLTTLATIVSLARQLPLQQVLLGAVVIASLGSLAHGLATVTDLPFGPIRFVTSGPTMLGKLAWFVPALWIVAVLNSRGVARLILRPWRKTRTYGFWLLGVTATLTVLFGLALEPFATRVHTYWTWLPTKLPWKWFDAPVTNLVGWILVSLLILAFATPCFIDKRPRHRRRKPSYHPLIVWLLCMCLFGIGAGATGLWLGAGFAVVLALTVATFSIRGARW